MRTVVQKWFGDVRRCATLLVALALLKGVVFVGLVGFGVTKPFIGANAEEIVFPIAERIVKEHRFNGADSRPDSKMGPAYPFLIAVLEALKIPAIPVRYIALPALVRRSAFQRDCRRNRGGRLVALSASGRDLHLDHARDHIYGASHGKPRHCYRYPVRR